MESTTTTPESTEKTFYATFGFGQAHQNCYTKVRATSSQAATEFMNRHYGNQWSMMYNSAEEAGVEQFGLQEIV